MIAKEVVLWLFPVFTYDYMIRQGVPGKKRKQISRLMWPFHLVLLGMKSIVRTRSKLRDDVGSRNVFQFLQRAFLCGKLIELNTDSL